VIGRSQQQKAEGLRNSMSCMNKKENIKQKAIRREKKDEKLFNLIYTYILYYK
jgi:hypothetical protein